MKKSTLIVVIVIMALCLTGMSAGGVKILDNINSVIDANRDPDIIVSEPDISELYNHVVSINNSSIGFDNYNNNPKVSFYSDEFVDLSDVSFIVAHYDFNISRRYTLQSLEFSLLYNHDKGIFATAKTIDNDFKLREHEMSNEPYDLYYSASLGSNSVTSDFIYSLTFVYLANSDDHLTCYVYVNDECLGMFEEDASDLYGPSFNLCFSGVSITIDGIGENEFVFDNIDVFTFSSDYEGDLFEVVEDSAYNITDSDDFNLIINAR